MKDQSRDYTWKGLIWGVVLYVLLAVTPAIIILRYFLSVDYVPLIGGMTAMLICFVLQIKRHWALGERVRKVMAQFFRFSKAKKNKKKEIHEIMFDQDGINDMMILAVIMFWFVAVIILLGHMLSFFEIELRFPIIDLCKVLGATLLMYTFHEALHAFAAMLWGKVPWRSIHFGFQWQPGVLYCHVDRSIKIGNYRIFVLFPLIVTTPTAGLILWLDPSIWSLLLFCITISACAGDVMVFFKVRRVENDKWVQDHPSAMGCYILSESKINGG